MTALRIQRLEIEDCEGRILREYFNWGWGEDKEAQERAWTAADEATRKAVQRRGYGLFDGFPAQPGNEIGPTEIFISLAINSRVRLSDACRFLERREEARPLLARIPDDARLETASEDQLNAAGELISLFGKAKGVKRGKITKVLHKKRPAFFAMLDAVVSDFLWKNFPWVVKQDSPLRQVLEQFRDLLHARAEGLKTVRVNLEAQGFRLSTVRVLDFLIWLGWHKRVDESGFGPPLCEVWDVATASEARRRAEETWRESEESPL